MPRQRRRRDGLLVFVTGSRGTGKTGWTRQRVETRPRLLVWDALQEFSRDGLVQGVRTLTMLHALIVADLASPGPFRYGYTGPINKKTFKAFCKLAAVWMKGAPESTVVIEELADVTHAGKAPEGWGELVREGRHFGGDIYALTQRPAETDKTVAGNCDILHACRLSLPRDRKMMAEYLDVPLEKVTALRNLDYIERDMRDCTVTSGRLNFSRPRRKR